MKIAIPAWLVTRIIRRAQATPYYHLTQADGSPYMDRWWLMPKWLLRLEEDKDCPGGTLKPVPWLPFSVRVHHIVSSDHDRHLHDHPFGYVTWIIAGGYWEVTPSTMDPSFEGEREAVNYTWHAPGAILRRRATDRHAIKVDSGGAWSIFIQFRKQHTWGFYTPRGKVYWWDYRTTPNAHLPRRLAAIRGSKT